uniref:Uncharacterized protein n=1 Tax=Pristionchus pacificus TaxID=54126 RepID=A0A2A6BFC5_PRIPA|eukprot:PDM64589.1 hypothetical protein PRIPAC_52845 [Pristionchus pacificus]
MKRRILIITKVSHKKTKRRVLAIPPLLGDKRRNQTTDRRLADIENSERQRAVDNQSIIGLGYGSPHSGTTAHAAGRSGRSVVLVVGQDRLLGRRHDTVIRSPTVPERYAGDDVAPSEETLESETDTESNGL